MEWVADVSQYLNPNSNIIYYDAKTKHYMEYINDQWSQVSSSRIDKIIDTKAYIDMPNQTFITFLDPRQIFFGLTLSYHF